MTCLFFNGWWIASALYVHPSSLSVIIRWKAEKQKNTFLQHSENDKLVEIQTQIVNHSHDRACIITHPWRSKYYYCRAAREHRGFLLDLVFSHFGQRIIDMLVQSRLEMKRNWLRSQWEVGRGQITVREKLHALPLTIRSGRRIHKGNLCHRRGPCQKCV